MPDRKSHPKLKRTKPTTDIFLKTLGGNLFCPPKKSFFSLRDFVFQGLEYVFQGLEHMFQDLEHKFQGLEQKIVPQRKTFSWGRREKSSEEKEKILGRKIKNPEREKKKWGEERNNSLVGKKIFIKKNTKLAV